ncbi:MAG: preprotein translocase subunit SecA [Cereibacter sp.]|jgi:preprotein translocase subunit SecA|nr:preprotein translocase subunit SecA [Cereibacter sp.]
MLRPRPVPLHAFARSRHNPARRKVPPIGKLALLWGEYAGWRLVRPPAAPAPALRAALPPLLAELKTLDDAALDARLAGPRPRAEQILTAAGARPFAEALEVVRRAMGFALRDNQIDCALSLLSGDCVELRTGEGKTLAAGLAALVAARAGVSCHVVTVNDYLARRDHELIAPIAARMRLSASVLLQELQDDERRAAYDADIVYGANKSFVFDHLRDRREAQSRPGSIPRQTGQAFAICDEADSVMIDDATVPMILSEIVGEVPENDLQLFRTLDAFAAGLEPGAGRVRDANGSWRLTLAGLRALEAAAEHWPHPVARTDEIVALAEKALAARWQFRRGDAYVLREGKVEMIDQSTGRLMPDRRWEFGLQQMVEIAAGAEPSAENRTVAQVTQQTFFRQYRLLSGLTGTARECRPEFWSIYRLPVRRIAPHAPLRLIDQGTRVFPRAAEKWLHVADRAEAMAATRAVLIGVNDVTETEALAAVFAARGRSIAVLDAMSEADEAALIAEAGRQGSITLATHLAGRGTDIALDPEVRAAGGLHVIIASAMVSSRLERQFYGRAGRAGDPGSYERAVSLQDRNLQEGAQPLDRRLLRLMLRLPLVGLRPWALGQLQAGRDRRARRLRRITLLREQDLVRQVGYR